MPEPSMPLSTIGVVRYHRPDRDYMKTRNDFARNSQLRPRAFRVASYMLSHADGFTQTQKQIAAACGLSVNTVREALQDLQDDRYLVRTRLREGGRWIGTAYAISDVPFTDSEIAELSPPHADFEHSESAPPKKIRSRRDTKKTREKDPSGGQTAVAATPSLEPSPIHEQQEDAVAAPVETITLFDVPAEKKRRDGRPEGPSAKTVTAAYVDSYRQHHSGADPVRATIGRVASQAKAILTRGDASPDELALAAKAMGEGPWSNLSVALNIHRQGGQRRKGFTPGTPARVHTHPLQQASAERVRQEEYHQLMVDDDLVRWVSQDSAVMADWVARYPELGQRFRDVA